MTADAPATGRYWGTHLLINLAGCQPDVVGDGTAIARWALELCTLIGMEPYGDPMVTHFGVGDRAGWTVVQLITTSNIIAHGNDSDRSAFIDVFSCRVFDTVKALTFTQDFFGAAAATSWVVERHVPAARAGHDGTFVV